MGVVLILFPEEENPPTPTTSSILNKKNKFLQQKSTSFIKRTTNQLLSKAQYTIFICALLILFSALLFTLSTFESPHPTSSSVSSSSSSYILPPRRQLSLLSAKSHFKYSNKSPNYSLVLPHALQGMGIMYRRGTKAMSDLIVAHVVESLNVNELKLFLRVLHKSALISRSDLVFIFPSKNSCNSNFDAAIVEESDSFLKLIEHVEKKVLKRSNYFNSTASFDAAQLMKWSKMEKQSSKPIWGRRITSRLNEDNETESTRLSYGSVIGFTVDELDLGNSLSGFIDHVVPMSLRRWACYPMLLGRVKRNYKHIMLIDTKEILLPGDLLSRLRNTSPESIWLYPYSTQFSSTKHGKKKSDKTRSNTVTPGIIIGGARGVRRLANAMLNDIVRMSMQSSKKRRNSVTELGVFNQLVNNEFLLKNVKLIKSTESISELVSLSELKWEPGSDLSIANFSVIRRGNSNFVVDSTLMKNIMCAWNLDSLFYRDCQ